MKTETYHWWVIYWRPCVGASWIPDGSGEKFWVRKIAIKTFRLKTKDCSPHLRKIVRVTETTTYKNVPSTLTNRK